MRALEEKVCFSGRVWLASQKVWVVFPLTDTAFVTMEYLSQGDCVCHDYLEEHLSSWYIMESVKSCFTWPKFTLKKYFFSLLLLPVFSHDLTGTLTYLQGRIEGQGWKMARGRNNPSVTFCWSQGGAGGRKAIVSKTDLKVQVFCWHIWLKTRAVSHGQASMHSRSSLNLVWKSVAILTSGSFAVFVVMT